MGIALARHPLSAREQNRAGREDQLFPARPVCALRSTASVLLDGDLVDRQGDGLRPGRAGHVGGQPHGSGLIEVLSLSTASIPHSAGSVSPAQSLVWMLVDSVAVNHHAQVERLTGRVGLLHDVGAQEVSLPLTTRETVTTGLPALPMRTVAWY